MQTARPCHTATQKATASRVCHIGVLLLRALAGIVEVICRELAAHGRTEEEVCSLIGADSLQYLTVEDMRAAASGLRWGHCDACFTGDYAVPVPHGH